MIHSRRARRAGPPRDSVLWRPSTHQNAPVALFARSPMNPVISDSDAVTIYATGAPPTSTQHNIYTQKANTIRVGLSDATHQKAHQSVVRVVHTLLFVVQRGEGPSSLALLLGGRPGPRRAPVLQVQSSARLSPCALGAGGRALRAGRSLCDSLSCPSAGELQRLRPLSLRGESAASHTRSGEWAH